MMITRTCLARILLLVLQIAASFSGWIDPDTPLDKRTTRSFIDGTTYHLVRCFKGRLRVG